ncbi:hypothetical protein, partial [Pseudomonas sp. UBA6699]|uniref:hypothetical protein n=1 Tax=Pseudomonas sp. UBA6699 TaxID=1947333 RepID=UPI0025805E57
ASCARSYVCFGPIMPVGFARERFGARLDMATYKQGGRARAALGFTGAAFLSPYKWQPSRDPRQPNKPHNHVYACGSTAPRAALAGRFISQS